MLRREVKVELELGDGHILWRTKAPFLAKLRNGPSFCQKATSDFVPNDAVFAKLRRGLFLPENGTAGCFFLFRC